ncbi:glycosyltransferase [Marinivivus vitaminiproducens]|uniref:glycosyltransferase n=1 Tax=Marinivivus vitaminiproducens TaxID=3035935 RepID=UPI002799E908|nr:glycosyltransferase [Geminicoccaceae bacterium SCSIO 64248]
MQRMQIILAGAFADRGYATDLVVCNGDGDLKDLVPANVRLVVLEKSSNLMARWTAARADPAALGILGPSIVLPRKISKSLPSLRGLAKYLSTTRPDALFSGTPHLNIEAVLARRLAGVKTRVVISERTHTTSDNGGAKAWRTRNLASAVGHVYRQADAIVAVSNGVAEDLAQFASLDRSRIITVHNPALTPDTAARAAEPVDHPWFADDGVVTILTVGRIGRQKDHTTLVRAFAKLRAEREARLVIIGEARDPTKRDQNRDRLLALAAELGVAQDIMLLGYQANPLRFMARASLFVLSSRFEGFGNVLIEALACGCPVVSTDCPSGPSEILDGGRFGRLTPVGDPDALAAAMAATLDNPPLKADLQARADEFSYNTAIERYVDILLGDPVGPLDPGTAGR